MSILITLLTVLLIFACVLMVLVILMQRPKQEGLGAAFGGGMTDSMFGAQTTNVLQRGTIYFAVFYFVASTALAVLVSKHEATDEDLGKGLLAPESETATTTGAEPAAGMDDPAAPVVPDGPAPIELPEPTTLPETSAPDISLDLDSALPEPETSLLDTTPLDAIDDAPMEEAAPPAADDSTTEPIEEAADEAPAAPADSQ